jgi:hypothetical protein
VRQAGDEAKSDRAGREGDDRDRGGCGFQVRGQAIRGAQDHVGLRGHDATRQVGIAIGLPFTGIPLHREVLTFDKAQPAQLLEEWSPIAWVRLLIQEIG